MCVHRCAHVGVCMHICVHRCACMLVWAYVCVCVFVFVRVHRCTHAGVYMHACVYSCACICVCTCIQVCLKTRDCYQVCLNHAPPLKSESLAAQEFTNSAILAGQRALWILVLCLLDMGLHVQPHTWLLHGGLRLNSGPHACTASTSLAEPTS